MGRVHNALTAMYALFLVIAPVFMSTLIGCATTPNSTNGLGPRMPEIGLYAFDCFGDYYDPPEIYFDLNAYQIRDEDRVVLSEVAERLSAYPDSSILIAGHTCALGDEKYNILLGMRRAEATQQALVALGIDARRMKMISHGSSMPLEPETAKNRHLHRRVSFHNWDGKD